MAAAKKAFITNRVGDFGLLIGIFLIYLNFGTLEFTKYVFANAGDYNRFCLWQAGGGLLDSHVLDAGGVWEVGAQFPLHVWLPDAMEGPTPVSALIHAATMVTAGIYMIARCMPLFEAIPVGLDRASRCVEHCGDHWRVHGVHGRIDGFVPV